MQKAIISFVLSAILGFGVGFLVFNLPGQTDSKPAAAKTEASAAKETTADTKDTATVSAVDQDNILAKRGCLGCHSVGSLNLKGGQVGPDLSQAYTTVEGKHGKPIEEFLKQPTSAVMSGVIGKNPLTDDERKQVLELLKKASEAK